MLLARRILFVTESFGIGGTETHLLELLPSLKAKGFDIAAFCLTELGKGAGQAAVFLDQRLSQMVIMPVVAFRGRPEPLEL